MQQVDSKTLQAVRPISKDSIDSPYPSTPGKTVFIDLQLDPVTHKLVVLWSDVVQAFEDALHIRYNSRIIPFMKGADLNPLVPHRIAAIPDVVLDIVVRGNSVRTEPASPQEIFPETPPMSRQEQTVKTDNSTINTTSAIRRNPVHGLDIVTMENYTHTYRPPTVTSSVRSPQALSTTASFTINNVPQSPPVGNRHTSRAPQETSATPNTIELAQIMFNAIQGDAKAQVILGDMYREGRNFHRDYQAAMDWYIKAAEQGCANGQFQIGYLYDVGLGISKDYVKAMEWYRKAADQGNANAQFNIAVFHCKGSGVPQDYSQAMEWFSKAASQLNGNAIYNVGTLFEEGLGTSKDLAKAMEWYLKGALLGHDPSQYRVGYFYSFGYGVPVDYVKAMEWYIKAANQGNTNAQDGIGVLYRNGQGIPKDVNKAINWFKKAAGQGHTKAKDHLERLKQRGYKIE